jgi:hypothetical protein
MLVTLIAVKNWPYILIVLIVLVGAGYLVYTDRERLGLAHMLRGPQGSESTGQTSAIGAMKQANIEWRMQNRAADGFRVEMPAGPKDSEVPAFTETGATEPVNMLSVSPDGDTVYAVTWQDNPPVARFNNNLPDRTLDQARDGMLTHTQTTLLSETRITSAGSPGREILARNASGGILNARLIYIQNAGGHDRLYTLMALYPTAGARREQDVSLFFQSFALESPKS